MLNINRNGIFKDKLGRSKLPVLKSRLFWAGIVIKLCLSVFFASAFMSKQFAPFANYFIESGFSNPYEHFKQTGTGNEFPYPTLMLWLFSIPRIVLWPLLGGSSETFTVIDSIIYRIPLLLADLAILFVLIRWLKTRTRQVLIWYWLSPILIYINYFHGQLDVLPIALLFISLYFLFRNKPILSFVILGLAIGCKTNMALVFPFYVIYLYRSLSGSMKQAAFSIMSMLAVIALINLPYLSSAAYINMVYNNPVQQQVFDLFYQFNSGLKIYFIPAVYFSLLVWYVSLKFVNRDQLVLFLAFTFLALTLMISPMQGWYYWIIPFLVYFAIKQDKVERQLLILLSGLYFLYFAFAANTDYHNSFVFLDNLGESPFHTIANGKIPSIIFTLLQTSLLITGVLVYRKGISGNIQTKFLSQPYLIGIGGDSAAGKSTLTNALSSVFEPQNTSIIRGDDMHKWERGDENWQKFTHLDPRANNLHQEISHAFSLKTGKRIKRSFYNHDTGKFNLPTFITPNKLIIFEGLHSFYLKNQADIYDLKIFMNPDEQLRVWWKVKRDVNKRGYTPEKVLEQLKQREEDSLRYIKSQEENADIVASFYSLNDLNVHDLETAPVLGLRLLMPNHFNLEPLLERLAQHPELKVEFKYSEGKLQLNYEGGLSKEKIERIAYRLIPELEDVGIYNAVWKDHYEGLLQLTIVYIVFSKLIDNTAN
jgi:uridine kinase/Gpi18-like mannosyltransferase